MHFHMMHCPSCRPRHCWASLGTLSSQTISLTLSQPSTLFFLVGAYKQYIYLRWCTNQILQSLLTHMPPHKCPLPCLRGCGQWGERIEGMLCHKRVSDGHIGVGEARWNSKKVSACTMARLTSLSHPLTATGTLLSSVKTVANTLTN